MRVSRSSSRLTQIEDDCSRLAYHNKPRRLRFSLENVHEIEDIAHGPGLPLFICFTRRATEAPPIATVTLSCADVKIRKGSRIDASGAGTRRDKKGKFVQGRSLRIHLHAPGDGGQPVRAI